jgi:hypothetical protein
VFDRNPLLDTSVFTFVADLPSIPTPDKTASPLRRARALARLLADDASGAAFLADAGAQLTARLNGRLDGLAAEWSDLVDERVDDLLELTIKRTILSSVGEESATAPEIRRIAAHADDVARDATRQLNVLPEGTGRTWFAHRVQKEPGVDRSVIRVRCAALLGLEGVRAGVEQAATAWVQEQLDRFRVEIANTTGATRDQYTRVMEQTSMPEAMTIQLRDNLRAATKDRDGDDLPTRPGHLFADAHGLFPVDLNDWERAVVDAEIARAGFVAWYRNPGTATPASLRIAYQNDAGDWASLQPDFVIVSRRSDGSFGASIVDPHGDHLADARAKLRALAAFADLHGHSFVRIESIAKAGDGSLRVLDLSMPAVRAEVLAFSGGKVTALYESDAARPYP